MSSWTANVQSDQRSTSHTVTDASGNRVPVRIATVRIDASSAGGVILRRLDPDGRDIYTTTHADEAAAKATALDEFEVREWAEAVP